MRSIINAAVCLLLPALHRAWTLSPRTLALPRQRALAMMATKEFVIGQGCFWGPQQAYDKLPVLETKVGYSGGNNTTPSYRTVCAGDGHTEAVKVVYDDATVSFDTLLNVFFDRDISEFDNGPGQYENVIFVSNDAERNAVERRRQQMATTNDPRATRFTVKQRQPFYVAEEYHQFYWRKQTPKVATLLAAAVCDLTPGLPQDVYKVGVVLTLVYVVSTLVERLQIKPLAVE